MGWECPQLCSVVGWGCERLLICSGWGCGGVGVTPGACTCVYWESKLLFDPPPNVSSLLSVKLT